MRNTKSFFSFTRREQYGIMVLSILIAAIFVIGFFIQKTTMSTVDEDALAQWNAAVSDFQEREAIATQYNDSLRMARQQRGNYYGERQTSYPTRPYEKYQPSEKKFPEPFPFDPNSIDTEAFVKLGFSEKQAETIVKYREKGAVFKSKADFKKVFVVSEEIYAHLEAWILLPDEEEVIVPENIVVELNTADTTALKQIKGIGSYLARQIVEYRQKLGGYHAIEQLLEINGIDEERLPGIAPHLTLDKAKIVKMELNKTPFKDFTRHPYFEYYIVKAIFEYKDKHGSFSSVEDLRKMPLIYNDLYNKIEPYLYIQ